MQIVYFHKFIYILLSWENTALLLRIFRFCIDSVKQKCVGSTLCIPMCTHTTISGEKRSIELNSSDISALILCIYTYIHIDTLHPHLIEWIRLHLVYIIWPSNNLFFLILSYFKTKVKLNESNLKLKTELFR